MKKPVLDKCKIVFSDVDGTLLNSEHRITPRTKSAIKALQEKDITFVIVSARSPSGIYPILKRYKFNCPIISYSGALILNEEKQVLFHRGIDKCEVKRILAFIEENRFDLSWCLYSIDEWVVPDKKDPRIICEENIVEAEAVQGTVDTITDNQINKILCICNPQNMSDIEGKLKKAFPQYSIVKSSDTLLEIMENGITKAAAIKNFCSFKDVDIKDTIAFGDNYNDIEMLSEAGCGFLMGNAPEELRRQIEHITDDNNHDGIYQALAIWGLTP